MVKVLVASSLTKKATKTADPSGNPRALIGCWAKWQNI